MGIAWFNIHNLGNLCFLPLKKYHRVFTFNTTTRLTSLMTFHSVVCEVGTEVLNVMLMKTISGYGCLKLSQVDPVLFNVIS